MIGIKVNDNGEILYSFHSVVDDLPASEFIIVEEMPQRPLHELYFHNGAIHVRPDKPSEYHIWETDHWVLSEELMIAEISQKRAQLLYMSDWTQLPDVSLATQALWTTYRQALRDITLQETYPVTVTWPVAPS